MCACTLDALELVLQASLVDDMLENSLGHRRSANVTL